MAKPLDRLTLLETFARIAERGSISAAARDLGLSQASASRQLQALERRFGVQLVRRTTHDLALTPAGRDLLGDARSLIGGWQAMEERHGAPERTVKGRLMVVAPIALGQRHLADIALAFQRDHPQVSIVWHLEDGPIRFAEIGCDCWVKVGPVPDETLIVRRFGTVERLLVATPELAAAATGRRRRPEGLAGLPCAALDPFEGGRIELTGPAGRHAVLRPPVRFSTGNIVALHRAALAGIGFAVMPRWFVAEDLEAGRLVDLLPAWRAPSLSVNAAFLPARPQPKRLTAFLEALGEGIAALPGIRPERPAVKA